MRKYASLFYGSFLAILILPVFYLAGTKNIIGHASSKNMLSNVEACSNFSPDDSVIRNFKYVLNGQEGEINLTMYPNLAECLHEFPKKTSLPDAKHEVAEDQDDKLMMNNNPQEKYLYDLAESIKKITPDKNDQARIAVSLVQGFKYDNDHPDDYDFPYVTAFKQEGICNETAKLTIMLLRDLGFGTAMFTFEDDNHQAAGIRCDSQYSFQNSGYCFIETTSRAIITDNVGENSHGRVNPISDGLTFDASKDFQDAQEYITLHDKKKEATPDETVAYDNFKKKYGLGKNNA